MLIPPGAAETAENLIGDFVGATRPGLRGGLSWMILLPDMRTDGIEESPLLTQSNHFTAEYAEIAEKLEEGMGEKMLLAASNQQGQAVGTVFSEARSRGIMAGNRK